MKHLLYACCAAFILTSCNQPANTGNTANKQVERNKALLQKYFDEIYNKHNPATLDSMATPDYVEHEIDPGYEANREGTKKNYTEFFKAFPDMTGKINFMVVDTDRIVVHGSFTATQSGEMMGKPASNKKVNIDGMDAYRFNKDGKIVEHWGYYEERKLMMQLGELPDANAKTGVSAAATSKTTVETKTTSKEVIKEKKK